MGLRKGMTNNPKGRPKGSQNKSTKDIRELFNTLLESNLTQIQKDITELSPKDRINVMLKISEFVIPKLRSVEMDSKFSDEAYKDYERLKLAEERTDRMTDEEMWNEIQHFQKVLECEGWDTSQDGFTDK